MESRWDGDCSLHNSTKRNSRNSGSGRKTPQGRLSFVLVLLLAASAAAAGQRTTLQLDPAKTTVKFTLGDVLHTVHGTFQLKRGTLQLDAVAGTLAGEIVVDARSGESGSKMRDGKMHREVLESEQYPEISFRPDRMSGAVNTNGKSSIRVHGIFNIHGMDREIEVPADAELAGDHWSATLHFTIPYVKWGMKNPSALFLRVNDSVAIDLVAGGSVTRP